MLTFEEARPWFVASDPPQVITYYVKQVGACDAVGFESGSYTAIELTTIEPACGKEDKTKNVQTSNGEEDLISFYLSRY